MQTTKYQAIKTTVDSSTKIEDHLVIEAPLQININGTPYTVVMRTPGDDIELIRGLLYAEDIYKKTTGFHTTIIKEDRSFSTIINVTIPPEDLGKGYLNKRTLLSVSSCGICGKQELDDIQLTGIPIQNEKKVSQQQLKTMYAVMNRSQETFRRSGGSHAAAIFDQQQQMLSIKEDIGRHNAVDKIVGDLLTNDSLTKAHCMLVSGRVSYEIVSKAFIAKIPIIVAVSACSTLAVDFAKEFGICLIGFSRNDKMTIYANPQYISHE